ncbi:low temperature requirement protein A [Streptomyces sp. NPDC057939]|uniref:low temperature requirement protein A n=1 Tax=Streptomyces sp. NPDC057939 TaxID=3346284 RepID=UPI0036E00593
MTESVAPVANEPGERHASWLELFFDLTAVAGVAQLAHLLHGEPGRADLALYTVMFLAFWTGWMLFTVYGNVTGEQVGTRTVLAGMFGMAVMAASVHGVREDKAWAFALAYLLVRSLAGNVWGRRGEYVADLPLTRVGLGVVPWIVSMWFDGPPRYALWALGLAIDLAVMFVFSPQRLTARVEREYAADGAKGPGRPPKPHAAVTNAPHLGERLGLFVLIVLGEAVAQMVTEASVLKWDWAVCGVGVGAFVLLLQLWSLSLRVGAAGIPLLADGALPLRLALPVHCFAAGAVAAFAAATGDVMSDADREVPDAVRWLMCGSLGVYLLIAGLAVLCSGRRPARALLQVGPALVLVAALCALADGWGPVALVWTLVLAVRWPLLVERLRPPPTPARAAP